MGVAVVGYGHRMGVIDDAIHGLSPARFFHRVEVWVGCVQTYQHSASTKSRPCGRNREALQG